MRLIYASDQVPGFRRAKRRGRFVYLNLAGSPIRDERVLRRIRALGIPPAYTDVWICRYANGHLQATGRDARGRKQYRYHPQWRAQRDAAKYDRMLEFSEHLPQLRRRVAADLRQPGMPREKILAAIVRLLESSLIRVGNEEYARANASFGLTTLKNDHVRVRGDRLQFRFRGKSGKFHDIQLADVRLARIVRRCQDLPGQTLFQYRNAAGGMENVRSDDANSYIRDIAGSEFSAKDFRTWAGTVLTAGLLARHGKPASATEAKSHIAGAIRRVAECLGNTPKICLSSYVHPAVLDSYTAGELAPDSAARAPIAGMNRIRLSAPERAVQRLLRRQARDHVNARHA
jgi:DNA topoisomerase-1